jgi:2-(1,2-epoxy-1,2-dihydrophenyl)acetyl-CoA isomerase
MMLGDKVSADEAMQMGMIYQSIADDQFSNAVDALASQLSNMPTKALALTKFALQKSMQADLPTQLQNELNGQLEAGSTADHQEGVQAFLEKRKAIFQGK